jgi:hypothetical protein
MAANLKGGNLGVIGFRTDETNNPLDDDEDYQNISVRVSLCLWGFSCPELRSRHISAKGSSNICEGRFDKSQIIIRMPVLPIRRAQLLGSFISTWLFSL